MSKSLRRLIILGLAGCLVVLTFVLATPVGANPPAPDPKPRSVPPADVTPTKAYALRGKFIDRPNPLAYQRLRERERLMKAGYLAEASLLAQTGTDRVLVILVEFTGPDVFTWTKGVSTWDPFGRADPNEAMYDDEGNLIEGDCSAIIEDTRVFTYYGPLHNQIPRPVSQDDRSGDTIWTEDFSPEWFRAFMFGDGVTFHYTRTDGSLVHEDFKGKSVKHYYWDMSGGTYTITGDVIGWVQVPHSTWYYGADSCPGGRSPSGPHDDAPIPGAGSPEQLVKDALDAVNAISNTIPGFDWRNYDLNGDGIIDRLWIVHAGYGEEDSATLLNRTDYGEAAIWSHSSTVTPFYPVGQGIKAGAYIIMPENGGIGVFAHEYNHNLGGDDLYSYGEGETSAGFWTLAADDWTGYPIGYQPPALDPWHLDRFGWLNPYVVDDPTRTHIVTLGQASNFPGGEGVYRGVKIPLPSAIVELPAQPADGQFQWWGGKENLANAMMTLRQPISVPVTGARLVFSLTYAIEEGWDFLWVQAQEEGSEAWTTLTNDDTVCEHDPSWIGPLYGFPDDLCGAGMGGFTGESAGFPAWQTQAFDLSAFAGKSVRVRFWYMTDWGSTEAGPFIDNVAIVTADGVVLFADGAESEDGVWIYEAPWERNNGSREITHNYYLQWRNVSRSGGYDSALGDARFRFGPANTGLLVWYNNNNYTDNEILQYVLDGPTFGPKGRMLVVDAHPDPYRDPYWVELGYDNESANVYHRSLMRDAPFSLWPSVDFTMTAPYITSPTVQFEGRPAVDAFHDALGYYPGAEFKRRSPDPRQAAPKWLSKQWDASAVIPSKANYSIKAPGYKANDEFRFGLQRIADGRVAAYFLSRGLGYAGGTGDPREVNGQYGWHVQILSQTEATATLKIWNAIVEKRVSPAPADLSMPGVYTLTYWVALHNQGAKPSSADLTFTLPEGAVPVEVSPSAGAVITDSRVIWDDAALPSCQWITFTVAATIEVKMGDPVMTVYQASAEVQDAETPGSWQQVWRTRLLARYWMPLLFKGQR